MAVGDCNVTPEEFMQSPWARKLKMLPARPNIEAACSSGKGRTLDCVICPQLSGLSREVFRQSRKFAGGLAWDFTSVSPESRPLSRFFPQRGQSRPKFCASRSTWKKASSESSEIENNMQSSPITCATLPTLKETASSQKICKL
eukprot:6140509-Pyramimonas_sp.AAC.1